MKAHHATILSLIATAISEGCRLTMLSLENGSKATLTYAEICAINRAMQQLHPVIADKEGCRNSRNIVKVLTQLGTDIGAHPDVWFFENCLQTLSVLFAMVENSTLTQDERKRELGQLQKLLNRS